MWVTEQYKRQTLAWMLNAGVTMMFTESQWLSPHPSA